MKLKRLMLTNFKGVKEFTLDLEEGKNANVFGDNATGKTTLNDAELWLLFGKDTTNRKDFEIKTLDANGDAIPDIDHTVIGVFELDGKELTLQRTYREDWTTTRGSAVASFSGHTTKYFINEVPALKKVYDAKIESISAEQVFKLLSNPLDFNTRLKWKERREILLAIAGDVTDSDVAASNEELAGFLDLLSGKTIDEFRAMLASQRKTLNNRIKEIGPRIDELQNSLPEGETLDTTSSLARIEATKVRIGLVESNIADLMSGENIAGLNNTRMVLQEAYTSFINNANVRPDDKRQELAEAYQKVSRDMMDARDELRQLEGEKESKTKLISRLEVMAEEKRREHAEQRGLECDVTEIKDTCPTCGQKLPGDDVVAQRTTLVNKFAADRAVKLGQIQKDGLALVAEIEAEGPALKELIEKVIITRDLLDKSLEREQSAKAAYEEEKERIAEPNLLYDNKKTARLQAIQNIGDEIDAAKVQRDEIIAEKKAEIDELKDAIREDEKIVWSKVNTDKTIARIADLEAEKDKLVAESETIEGKLHLSDVFIVSKVNILEAKINELFEYATFKMFNKQINGGIEECCETVFEGVPFADLNNAAKINIGLDIINTISNYYNFSAPVFIDNSEAVNKLLPVNAQLIRLVVSKHKKLKVEVLENDQ